jgi:hypothetical protein
LRKDRTASRFLRNLAETLDAQLGTIRITRVRKLRTNFLPETANSKKRRLNPFRAACGGCARKFSIVAFFVYLVTGWSECVGQL